MFKQHKTKCQNVQPWPQCSNRPKKNCQNALSRPKCSNDPKASCKSHNTMCIRSKNSWQNVPTRALFVLTLSEMFERDGKMFYRSDEMFEPTEEMFYRPPKCSIGARDCSNLPRNVRSSEQCATVSSRTLLIWLARSKRSLDTDRWSLRKHTLAEDGEGSLCEAMLFHFRRKRLGKWDGGGRLPFSRIDSSIHNILDLEREKQKEREFWRTHDSLVALSLYHTCSCIYVLVHVSVYEIRSCLFLIAITAVNQTDNKSDWQAHAAFSSFTIAIKG